MDEVTMYALNLAEDGRILSATYQKYAPADAVLVEHLPAGETKAEQDIHNWLCLNGEYVFDPLPEPEPGVQQTEAERIAELEEAIALLLSGVTE
jgi:hypothetical protein